MNYRYTNDYNNILDMSFSNQFFVSLRRSLCSIASDYFKLFKHDNKNYFISNNKLLKKDNLKNKS